MLFFVCHHKPSNETCTHGKHRVRPFRINAGEDPFFATILLSYSGVLLLKLPVSRAKASPNRSGPRTRLPSRLRNGNLHCRRQTEHYPPPLYALEWITTLFGLAARPLISLVALDLFLAGARNPVLRLCVSLLGGMEEDLLALDQEGLLKEFRSRAVAVDAEEVRFLLFLFLFFVVVAPLEWGGGG